MSALAHRPRHDTAIPGDDLAALEAAVAVRRAARDKGLPDPLKVSITADGVEAALLMPDLLRHIELLDPATARVGVDAAGYLVVHGATGDQHWTLRPVHEPCPAPDSDGVLRVCRRCADLPDTYRVPLTTDAWLGDAWWRLVGKRWEQETGFRAPHHRRAIDDMFEQIQAQLDTSFGEALASCNTIAAGGAR